jgi:hypothetical protein
MALLRGHQLGPDDADRAGATGAGQKDHPIFALVSDAFAQSQRLRVGDAFSLQCAGGYSVCLFTVGATVHDFPTMYPGHSALGFIVVDLYDYAGAVALAGGPSEPEPGPNEYWLKTTDDAAERAALAGTLVDQAPTLDLAATVDRRDLAAALGSNALQTGMRGLLTLGAAIAAALAVLGTVTQSALAARQRVLRFAVLRTLGMSGRQLLRLLLGEQLVVYLFGLAAGTALGLILITATLPFLRFSDVTVDPVTLGVPPYVLAVDSSQLVGFYAALLVAFVVALAVAAFYAARIGLGKALRLGED